MGTVLAARDRCEAGGSGVKKLDVIAIMAAVLASRLPNETYIDIVTRAFDLYDVAARKYVDRR
jgi:hypothetical protein